MIWLLTFGCSDYNLTKEEFVDLYDSGLEEFEADPEGEAPPVVDEDDCVETDMAFDIEEISTLQDAFGLPLVQDGLMMQLDLSAGALGWRPTAVEVLVMMPTWYFEYYDNSNALTVHVYDGPTPISGERYTKTLPIRKADLNWAPLTLPPGADWSGSDPEQIAAWLRFDLTEIIPTASFQDTEYFVAVAWDDMGFPNVGYSNFELPCTKNWTDYGDGHWKQNSGDDCSWPMFKIEVEQVIEDEC